MYLQKLLLNQLIYNMEELKNIPEPTGNIILKFIPPEKEIQGPNGTYYHYADVCTLIKKYRKELLTNFCQYIQWVMNFTARRRTFN